MEAADDARRLGTLRARLVRLAPASAPIGAEVHVLDEVDSTNDVAQQLALDGAPEGTLVIARTQRRGRGRRGTTFHSPAGSGLYCSTILRPRGWPSMQTPPHAATGCLTLMAGVAVAQTAHEHGATAAELKWPNDVVVPLADGQLRKLAGVLAEATAGEDGLQHVVLGIGINVTAVPEADGLEATATSLQACVRRAVAVEDVAVSLITALGQWTTRLQNAGPNPVIEAWRRYAPSTEGRSVSWVHEGRRVIGIARGIDDSGALQIDLGGTRTRVVAGAVEWEGYGA